MTESVKTTPIIQVDKSRMNSVDDWVVVEDPMEIRVVAGPNDKRRGKGLSITMRTPGHDFELAVGFLLSEGIIENQSQIQGIEYCGPVANGTSHPNTVRVDLTPQTDFEPQNLQRHFYTTSSCGVCGKASLAALEYQNLKPVVSDVQISRSVIFELPQQLRQQQALFERTGGIHAAGLFDATGQLKTVREDVGRHNALDKLIGHHLLAKTFPLTDLVLVVSGRASFELLQKALAVNVAVFVAVGAPSSLAIELAEKFNVTLIGFTNRQRFNIYAGKQRIA